MFKIPRDVIIFPEKDGKWIIMNVFTRTCLAVDGNSLEFFNGLDDLESIKLNEKKTNNSTNQKKCVGEFL